MDEAIATLVEIMADPSAPPRERRACAAEILDRGFGRPVDRSVVAQLSGQVSDAALSDAQLAQIAAGALDALPQPVDFASDSGVGEGAEGTPPPVLNGE